MRTAVLGELCDFLSGGTPDRKKGEYYGGEIPWISGADITANSIRPRSFITELALNRSAARLVPQGTVLLVTRTSIGKVTVADTGLAFSQDITALLPRPGLDPRFLVHFLKSQKQELLKKARGATIKGVTREAVASLRVPVFSVHDQRRIADILDKADALRAKRREAIAHLDSLGQSIFQEMFGEARSDSFPIRRLGELVDFYAGSSLPEGDTFMGQEDGYLLLKVSDMNRVGNESKIVSAALWSKVPGPKSGTLPSGSLILPKRGASIATNKKRVVERPSVLDPNLMGIHPGSDLSITFLRAFFENFDLASITSGSSVPQLNKKDLSPIEVSVPPTELQAAFVLKMAQLDSLKAKNRAELAELDNLFLSLQDRAFKGEL